MQVQSFNNFRINVVRVMQAESISMRELGRRLGTSNAYVCQVLNGKVVPSIDRCEQIAIELGCTLTDLLAQPRTERRTVKQ